MLLIPHIHRFPRLKSCLTRTVLPVNVLFILIIALVSPTETSRDDKSVLVKDRHGEEVKPDSYTVTDN